MKYQSISTMIQKSYKYSYMSGCSWIFLHVYTCAFRLKTQKQVPQSSQTRGSLAKAGKEAALPGFFVSGNTVIVHKKIIRLACNVWLHCLLLLSLFSLCLYYCHFSMNKQLLKISQFSLPTQSISVSTNHHTTKALWALRNLWVSPKTKMEEPGP